MKALLFDIGNSRLKWGVYEHDRIQRAGFIEQSAIADHGLAALATKLPRNIELAWACNVAGTNFARRLSTIVTVHCGCEVRFARVRARQCGVTNGYRQPRQLGVDRWVAMIGARAACNAACVIVDAGTAITIDALDKSGKHLGGQIMPGITLMQRVLVDNTSDISSAGRRVARKQRETDIFANSTAAAVAEGALSAAIGSVERALRALRDEAADPVLFVTGGDAPYLLKFLGDEVRHQPHLVLQGLGRVLEDSRPAT